MSILDTLFVSKEERQRRAKEFDGRVFPFGMEEQRETVRKLLSTQLGKGRGKENELLFAYLIAKDKYLLNDKGEKGLKNACAQLKNLGWLSKGQKKFILALVLMDTEIQSIEEYPSEDDIYAYIEQNSELLSVV